MINIIRGGIATDGIGDLSLWIVSSNGLKSHDFTFMSPVSPAINIEFKKAKSFVFKKGGHFSQGNMVDNGTKKEVVNKPREIFAVGG
jgi:hypothetical protein